MIKKIDAIMSLVPTAEVVVRDDQVEWHNPSIAPVTEEQIVAEIARLEAEYQAKQYQRQRVLEYPPISDQLDMLYHDRINNTDTWMEAVQAVKNKYPKS